MAIYVNMHDKFLSGWGKARAGRSLYSIKCATLYQAEAIEKAAHDRSEMKRVTISQKPPRARMGDALTVRDFSAMGGPWLKYYNPAHDTGAAISGEAQ